MEKYNLIIYRILILIICNSLYSQSKAIVPKNGAIVFVKKEIITDTLLYKKTFEKVFDKVFMEAKKDILIERGYANSQVPDSINQQLNQMFEMMKLILLQEITSNETKSLIKYHHIYCFDPYKTRVLF
jgi:hypothetical protein